MSNSSFCKSYCLFYFIERISKNIGRLSTFNSILIFPHGYSHHISSYCYRRSRVLLIVVVSGCKTLTSHFLSKFWLFYHTINQSAIKLKRILCDIIRVFIKAFWNNFNVATMLSVIKCNLNNSLPCRSLKLETIVFCTIYIFYWVSPSSVYIQIFVWVKVFSTIYIIVSNSIHWSLND